MQSNRESKTCAIFVPAVEAQTSAKKNSLFQPQQESNRMLDFDTRYFQSKGYNTHSTIINCSSNNTDNVRDIISQLAELPREQEILICFTAHGSPEKIGVGREEDRITIEKFIEILKNNGIEQLQNHHIHFQFRSCNSAYIPLSVLENRFYLKQHRDNIPPDAQTQIKNEILEKSLIGKFYKKTIGELGFSHVSVSGFRGYYCPDQKGPRVSATYPPKKAIFSAEDRIVTITSEGQVEANIPALLKIPNIPELSGHFTNALPVAQSISRERRRGN